MADGRHTTYGWSSSLSGFGRRYCFRQRMLRRRDTKRRKFPLLTDKKCTSGSRLSEQIGRETPRGTARYTQKGESICLILDRMASSELVGLTNIALSAKNTSMLANTGIWIAGITGCVKAATPSTFQPTTCPSWIVFSPFPCATIGSFREFTRKTGTYGWVFASVFLVDLREPRRGLQDPEEERAQPGMALLPRRRPARSACRPVCA